MCYPGEVKFNNNELEFFEKELNKAEPFYLRVLRVIGPRKLYRKVEGYWAEVKRKKHFELIKKYEEQQGEVK